ncbi:MAG TPA: response regulator [Acetobacteraceae bacterium]|nr:response regulator [Acetobacteraceae bacterium]
MSSIHREELIRALPYARRYARALTGNQGLGDRLVADSLRAIIEAGPAGDPRLLLYQAVTSRFDAGRQGTLPTTGPEALSMRQRQLLLLTTLEEVALDDAAAILGIAPAQAAAELHEARERLHAAAATDVLIIEDEPIIAMDIEELVQSCGHRVVGVASSEPEAIDLARRTRPGLILADINLGHGGDGSTAVARIGKIHHAPVIFVTAYPERLLTGEAVEPAFVITKPFEPLALAIATYQAVTGGVSLG